MSRTQQAARAAILLLAAVVAIGCDDTMTGPKPTPTPLPGPTPTPGPPRIVHVGQSAMGQPENLFLDTVSNASTTTIKAGTSVEWIWLSGYHSTTSGTCPMGCVPDGNWNSGIGAGLVFQHTFPTPGTFPYFCSVHGTMMQGTVIVQ